MEKRKAEQAQAVLELRLAVLSMMVQAGPTERVNLIKGWEEAKESPSSPPEGVTSLWWGCPWCVQGRTRRPVWLEWRGSGGAMGEGIREITGWERWGANHPGLL